MSAKAVLKQRFELRGEAYTLAYFPDPNDPTQIEPNFSQMQATQAGCSPVRMPDGRGGTVEKFMTWATAEIPARAGTPVPTRRFLLFRIFERHTPPQICPMPSMIVYAVQPTAQGDISMEQAFINTLLGAEEAPPPPREDWASSVFTVAREDAAKAAEDIVSEPLGKSMAEE